MGSYKKKLFIVLLLFLLISFFVCSSVNAATSITDTYEYSINYQKLLENEQELYANMFFFFLNQSNISESDKNDLINKFNNKYYYFAYRSSTTTNGWKTIYVYFYDKNYNYNALSTDSGSTFETEHIYVYDPNYLYNVSGYILSSQYSYLTIDSFMYNKGSSNVNVSIPTFLIGYQNENVSKYLITGNVNESAWGLLFSAIDRNTEETEDVKDELKKLNDFMSSDNVDSGSYDMPGNNDNPTQDITEQGVNNIFDMFYQRIINWDSALIRIEIPFTNKYFDIRPNLTENIVANFPNGAFKNLLGLVWYYLLGVYVVKDVQKYIDGLQTGEILTKSDTNIKTDML